jgi:NADH:ubiquinone oxidoreductase subunit H
MQLGWKVFLPLSLRAFWRSRILRWS